MRIEWNRVARTAVQSACGAGIGAITAIVNDFSREAIIAAGVQFVSTVAIAILMNLKQQTED